MNVSVQQLLQIIGEEVVKNRLMEQELQALKAKANGQEDVKEIPVKATN